MKISAADGAFEMNEKDLEAIGKVSKTELGQLVSTQIGFWRWNNLVRTAEKFKKKCEEHKLDAESVAPKFLVPFLEGASLEDDGDLQDMWASLLLSEVESSGSVAPRTLNALKHMSKEEALTFQSMFGSIFTLNDDCCLYRYSKDTQGMDDVITLADCGVLASDNHLLHLTVNNSMAIEFPVVVSRSDSRAIFAHKGSEESMGVRIPVYVLSRAGKELFLALHGDEKVDDLERILSDLNSRGGGVKFSLGTFEG
ncbi:DUF2806 domain-containing protein [Candidatus Saccharibacteria bacterium]|nr:DUF2806 domain-containing protein [Candidatus Saccharibacteria bacterium]